MEYDHGNECERVVEKKYSLSVRVVYVVSLPNQKANMIICANVYCLIKEMLMVY